MRVLPSPPIRPVADPLPYVRGRLMELRVTAAATVGVTVFATVWTLLGPVGQGIIVAAAVVTSMGVLWRHVAAPVLRTISNAARAYDTLTGVDEKLDQVAARMDADRIASNQRAQGLDERVTKLEDAIDWLRRRVGTRDEDHPRR